MAIVRFKYDGKFGRAARGSGAIITRELNALGEEMRNWVRANTKEDTGESRRKTVHFITGQSTRQVLHVEGQAPQSLFSQQTGRKAGGKQPPPENMLALVRRKGLTLRPGRRGATGIRNKGTKGKFRQKPEHVKALAARRATLRRRFARLRPSKQLSAQKSLAFLIGRSIKRRGIKAPRLFTRVLFTKRGAINRTTLNITRGIARLING